MKVFTIVPYVLLITLDSVVTASLLPMLPIIEILSLFW